MSKMNDGGPAYPVLDRKWEDGEPHYVSVGGASIRDYFAAKAPPASDDWMSLRRQTDRSRNPYNDSRRPPVRSDIELRAAWTYEWADAMLKARSA